MSKIDGTLECINALMESMNKYKITSVKIKDKDFEIELCSQGVREQVFMNPVISGAAAPVTMLETDAKAAVNVTETPRGNIVKAPIVGTYYSSSSPKDKAFVTTGQKVLKGDVLFIIESMKVMNEVKSEFDGTVTVINVKDGEAVEYDQPVMIIE